MKPGYGGKVSAALIVGALLLAACGGGTSATSNQGPQATGPEQLPSTAFAPPTSTAAAVPSPVGTWTLNVTFSSGYSTQAVLTLTAPMRDQGAITSLDPGACTDINPQTDAVAVADLKLTNTTQNFSATMGFDLEQVTAGRFPSNLTLEGDLRFSGGAIKCQDDAGAGGTTIAGVQGTSMAPGSTVENRFFIVFKNYYGPNTPQGDTANYANTALTGLFSLNGTAIENSSAMPYAIPTIQGPAVVTHGGFGEGYPSFYASGTVPPGG